MMEIKENKLWMIFKEDWLTYEDDKLVAKIVHIVEEI